MYDPSRVEELFFAALEMSTPEERAAYLADTCRDTPELRQRVEMLLASHFKAQAFLEPRAANSGAANDSSPQAPSSNGHENGHAVDRTREHVRVPTETIGSRIGPYKLLQQLGEGGMGTVYMAEQEHPVRRRVALKIIKTGMDSAQVVARFEQERQALAMMDHPNIAKVLDAGATETGRPYFVMELVKGIPITRFCDQEHLTPQERLELFMPVCQAVQHAHQKGIIHRDLKPSNVLIALYDGKAVPKAIDFGVAKAIHQKLTERTMFTEVGSIVGTLEYMAPEQAELNNLDIDTRADIYSLGVLLYELLTGSPPFTAKQLRGAAFTEMLRMIREVEPPKPSTRLSSSDELPSIAANRKLEPRRLTSLVTGELDWIVMKALEKDRGRRYETANGLAMDIARYLADEPVLASPPSAAYRMKKFVRRNKGPVTATVALLLALFAGVVGTSIGLVRAENARQAEQKQREIAQTKEREAVAAAERERMAKEEVQTQKSEAEAARALEAKERGYAEAIAKFVKDDFLALTSVEGQTRFDGAQLTKDATLRDLLDRAAEKLKDRKDLAPRTEAELCWIIGVSYLGVGEYTRAVRYLERSVDLYRQASGPEEDATLNAQNSLAVAYGAAGQNDRALPLFEQLLNLRKAKLGPNHPETLASMHNLAAAYHVAGQLEVALLLYQETFKLRKAHLGPGYRDMLISMNSVAGAYESLGKPDLALPIFEETLKLRQTHLGPDHLDTLASMNSVARAYQAAGKLDLALPIFEETLKLRQTKLGPDHPDTHVSMGNLARAYHDAGKLDLALPILEETLKLMKANVGPDHPTTLNTMSNLARLYWQAKELDKAILLNEEALKRKQANLGAQHLHTLQTVAGLGICYKDAGRVAEALPLLEEAHRAAKKYPTLRWVHDALLDAYTEAGENAKLANLLQEHLPDARKTLPQDSPQLAGMLAQIGLGLLEQKQWAEAEPLLRECLGIREKAEPDAWTTFNTQSMLGGALLGQKKYADAEPLLLAGYEEINEREATIPPEGKIRLTEAIQRLVEFYAATDQPEKADEWRAKLEAAQPKKPATEP